MMKVLVTGGAGFIGSHLVDELVAKNREVIVLDNLYTGNVKNLQKALASGAVQFVEGDIRDEKRILEILEGVSVVFHLAALGSVANSVSDPLLNHDVNVNGTLNLLWAMKKKGVPRLITAASCAAYGDISTLPLKETMAARPLSPYAVSKLVQEQYALAFSKSYGLEAVSLRFFNVYGERQDANSQYAAVIPKFFESYLSERSPTIFGDGLQTRDFIYVADVVRACILASKVKDASGFSANICTRQANSINRLADLIRTICGSEIQPIYEKGRVGEVRESVGDFELAKFYLGWDPIYPLEEGLRKTHAWYRK